MELENQTSFKVALFGEAEKGAFEAAYLCDSLVELSEYLGGPPSNQAQGLPFAIQTLLYNKGVIFFRVHEEGFSKEDYLKGLQFLSQQELFPQISAICLPGVGDKKIISTSAELCHLHKSILILTQKDLYDYLTN